MDATTDSKRSEPDLLTKAKSGCQISFNELIRRVRSRAFGMACRVCGDGDAAEDAVQEATVRAWKSFSSYEARGDFATWFCSITRNAALRLLARESPAIRGDETLDALVDASRLVDEEL